MAHPYKYAGENVDLQGSNLFKVCSLYSRVIGSNDQFFSGNLVDSF